MIAGQGVEQIFMRRHKRREAGFGAQRHTLRDLASRLRGHIGAAVVHQKVVG